MTPEASRPTKSSGKSAERVCFILTCSVIRFSFAASSFVFITFNAFLPCHHKIVLEFTLS
jgi:hypothetical protein